MTLWNMNVLIAFTWVIKTILIQNSISSVHYFILPELCFYRIKLGEILLVLVMFSSQNFGFVPLNCFSYGSDEPSSLVERDCNSSRFMTSQKPRDLVTTYIHTYLIYICLLQLILYASRKALDELVSLSKHICLSDFIIGIFYQIFYWKWGAGHFYQLQTITFCLRLIIFVP